jgi:hypothetical protein
MEFGNTKAILFLAVLITFTGLSSANLEWEKGKYNLDYASEDANQIYTAKLVNLSNEEKPVKPEDIHFYPDDFELGDFMDYDNGESGKLNYSSSLGLWYASFPQYKSNIRFRYRDKEIDNSERELEFTRSEGKLASEFIRIEDRYTTGQSGVDIGANIDFDNSNDINNSFFIIYNGTENFLYT